FSGGRAGVAPNRSRTVRGDAGQPALRQPRVPPRARGAVYDRSPARALRRRRAKGVVRAPRRGDGSDSPRGGGERVAESAGVGRKLRDEGGTQWPNPRG